MQRPASERLLRAGLRHVVPRPATFAALLKAGRALRPLLPGTLQDKIPAAVPAAAPRPPARHARRVLMLEGCVQPSLSPNTNAAAARVLDRLGISVSPAREAGCCGATEYHLNAQEAGLARARRNIDAWWPAIEAGAEAIVLTASGCGAFVKEYGDLLRSDPVYAEKAQRVSMLARDLAEVIAAEPLDALAGSTPRRIAVHCPCTLQHAQPRRRGRAHPDAARLRSDECRRRPSVLRLGRHVFADAARPRDETARQPARRARGRAAGPDCHGQRRLPDSPERRGPHARAPLDRLVDNHLVN